MKLCNKAHEADLETRDPYPVMEELELQPRKTTLLLCPSTYFGDISCPFGKCVRSLKPSKSLRVLGLDH